MNSFVYACAIRHTLLLLLVAIPLASLARPAPYTPDFHTRNLWHFDEAADSKYASDAVSGGTSLAAILNGATLGHPSLVGFGSAASTFDAGPGDNFDANGNPGRDTYLGPLPLIDGTADNSTLEFTGVDGAFTIEVLIRVDFDPVPVPFRRMSIVSADSEESERLFQFFMLWNQTNDPTPEIRFINIVSPTQTLPAIVPLSGPNSLSINNWYHIAVTYNGEAATAGNFKFYWTKVEADHIEADLLKSERLDDDLSAGSADWPIGNEGRAPGGPNENRAGLIDEVRLSSVARGPDDFIFGRTSVQAPVSAEPDDLPDAWELANFGSLAETETETETDDFDGDWFSNGEELDDGTDPTDAESHRTGLRLRVVQVNDGGPNTREHAHLRGINTAAFIQSTIMTVGTQQFITYYGQHETKPDYPLNNTVWVARRTVGSRKWDAASYFAKQPDTPPTSILHPYRPDADTLHLWNFDDYDSFEDSGIATGNTAYPLNAEGTLSSDFWSIGLGKCVQFHRVTDTLLAGENVPTSDFVGPDGSFTYEAVIKLNELPSTTGRAMQIISMENEGTTLNRVFQFKITPDMTLAFINVANGGSPPAGSLPMNGANAVGVDRWFHVAATYDAPSKNFTYYWTRMDLSKPAEEAFTLLKTTMINLLGTGNADFAVGNEHRDQVDSSLSGQIDEVRISGIARSADDFLFAILDSDQDGMPDGWERDYFESPDGTASGDFDGDGQSNEAEYIAGTHPDDPDSSFEIKRLESTTGNGFMVTWDSVVGREYVVWRSSILMGEWTPSSERMPGTGGELSSTDPARDPVDPQCICRVEVIYP